MFCGADVSVPMHSAALGSFPKASTSPLAVLLNFRNSLNTKSGLETSRGFVWIRRKSGVDFHKFWGWPCWGILNSKVNKTEIKEQSFQECSSYPGNVRCLR